LLRSTVAITACLTAVSFGYYLWAKANVGPERLFALLLSEISTNAMFCVLILLIDAFMLYYYKPKMGPSSTGAASNPPHSTAFDINRPTSPRTAAQLQMGYFSPKSKNPPAATAGSKHQPFDTGKFSYAR